jgi:uncharacterized repeat protein (TIGR02543 family)
MSASSVISDNTAVNGGGVYVNAGWFNATGGEISGNTATNSGGGIWVTGSPVDSAGLERLTVDDAVAFSNNMASGAYDRDSTHDLYYNALIGPNVVWSEPFTQGYNNYDISYVNGPQQVLYYIHYNPNTGVGSMSDTPVIYNTLVTLKPNTFSNAGYTFAGWNTAAAGSGTAYTDNESFNYLENGDLTLYAQWLTIPVYDFSVTYVSNGATGGSVPVDNNMYYSGESVYVAANIGNLVRSGYTFMGWAYSSTASVADFAVIDNSISPNSFTIYNDVTLHAVWVQNVYTVTYEPGSHGTFATQVTGGLHYGDQTPTAPTVTGDAGWNFTNWSPTPSTTVTGNAAYVAQWTQITTPPTPFTTPTPTPTPSITTTPTPSVPTSPPPSTTVTPTPTPVTSAAPIPTLPGSTPDVSKWAVVNLLLSVVGVILAVVVFVCALLLKKKKDGKVERKSVNSKILSDDAKRGGQNSGDDVADEKFTQRRNLWLTVTMLLAIIGVVVFLLTEDLCLPVGWVDKWTLVNVALLMTEIVVALLIFKRTKVESKQKQLSTVNKTLQ